MKTKIWLGVGLALVSGATLAQDFQSWDRDGDGVISAEEFRLGREAQSRFDGADRNGDGILNEDEFATLDEEDDIALLDEDEFSFDEDSAFDWGGDEGLTENTMERGPFGDDMLDEDWQE